MKNRKPQFNFGKICVAILYFLILGLVLTASQVVFDGSLASLDNISRWDRFNFFSWEISALVERFSSATMGVEHFIDDEKQSEIVLTYLNQIGIVEGLEQELLNLNSDPAKGENSLEILSVQEELERETKRMHDYARIAESILQNQTERSLVEMGFGLGGQIFPPVLFKITDLPLNLIISPRDQIYTLKSYNLKAGMDSLEKAELEEAIFEQFGFSALVEPVGGVGAYPTMVMRSRSINWLTEVIAHEWFHNYLTFYPLGIRYFENDTMKTINETTANLAGKEVGRQTMLRFYPEYLGIPIFQFRKPLTVLRDGIEENFDYRREMRETRQRVDYLLSIGRIDQAESYMEDRRAYFWEHGYRIRKINQAYFAFYGAYNDTPGGGAAGDDPIGPAIQQMRIDNFGLKAFIDEIKRIKSFEELMEK